MLDRFDPGSLRGSTSIVRSIRLRCGEITYLPMPHGQQKVGVELLFDEQIFRGESLGDSSRDGLNESIAIATLQAACHFLGLDQSPFELMGIRHITTTPVPICMVLIEFLDADASSVLVGSVELTDGADISVQRATMDAINRKVSVLYKDKED